MIMPYRTNGSHIFVLFYLALSNVVAPMETGGINSLSRWKK